MPLKRNESNKRYISSDSEESSYCETPKTKGSTVAAKRHNDHRRGGDAQEMVNHTNHNDSYDIRLANGKANGVSMDTTNTSVNSSFNSSLNTSLNPVVSLNRDAIDSHMKRKSLGFSAPKATPIQDRDEREDRRRRQNERVFQQRRSAVGVAGTPRSGPSSSATSGLSGDQLKEHYTHCIQLSANNKINVKNAFGLHLIDYMSELNKQNEQNQSMNFKLAASALDAGAKIYYHRVDSVHAEAQKVASSLVMALNKDKNAPNNGLDDNMDTNDDNNDMNEDNDGMNDSERQQKQRRKKTTKRNVKTLAQNMDSLNVAKVEANVEIDPVFHHLSAAFDMGNVNSLLMANLKISPLGMLLLDSNSSLNFDEYIDSNREPKTQEITKFYTEMSELQKTTAQICPKLSSFSFLNRSDGIDLIPREEDPSYTPRKDSFAFDLNAETEDIDDLDCEDMGGDMFDNNDDDSDDGGGGFVEAPDATAKKALFRAVNMQGVGDLVKMLSDKPNDYTYFNPKLLSSWAGPMHWKRVPFWNKNNRVDGQGGGEVGADKPRRQRKVFPEQHYREEEFDETESDRMAGNDQKLKVLTLQKWHQNNSELKLPADHGFDPKVLARSFVKPESIFQCAKSHEDVMDATLNSNDDSYGAPVSPGVERYDYDDDDIPTGGFTDPLELGHSVPLSQLNTNAFTGDNLVEQPYDLQNIVMDFAKFAKKMDVKRLKRAMWDVISPLNPPNTPLTPEANRPMSPETMSFTTLYKDLQVPKITPVMAQNLSTPIAFVTLLHLCNERNLKLVGIDDLSDFIIETEVLSN